MKRMTYDNFLVYVNDINILHWERDLSVKEIVFNCYTRNGFEQIEIIEEWRVD